MSDIRAVLLDPATSMASLPPDHSILRGPWLPGIAIDERTTAYVPQVYDPRGAATDDETTEGDDT